MPAKKEPIDSTLAALADPARRAVVDLLRVKPRHAGELSAALRMSPAAMSRHLRVLRLRGLVDGRSERHDARFRTYRLRRGPFRDLNDWLDQVEAFWTGQLHAFKAHAERTSAELPE